MKGVESSRPPTPTSSSSSASTSSADSSSKTGGNTNNTPAIIGGVVGGVAVLGLLAALILFLVLRSRQKSRYQIYSSNLLQSPNMAFTPNTTTSLVQSGTMPPPGMVYVSRHTLSATLTVTLSLRTLRAHTLSLIPT